MSLKMDIEVSSENGLVAFLQSLCCVFSAGLGLRSEAKGQIPPGGSGASVAVSGGQGGWARAITDTAQLRHFTPTSFHASRILIPRAFQCLGYKHLCLFSGSTCILPCSFFGLPEGFLDLPQMREATGLWSACR